MDQEIFKKLFPAYTALLTLNSIRLANKNATKSISICSNIWLGFILAISGTEAWVKFRSPLMNLPSPNSLRILLFDVGAQVFCAANAVELSFGLNIVLNTIFLRNSLSEKAKKLLLSLFAVQFIQTSVMTPKLIKLVKKRIHQNLVRDDRFKDLDEIYNLGEEVAQYEQLGQVPNRKLHLYYLFLELYKFTALLYLTVN
eukprot:snap_masked-scaffold_2-processed-gene-11.1-mRNA-1 protein AED:1.00 eAED:1.00 QI:0/-1/0/0/-1/1/1/0/198